MRFFHFTTPFVLQATAALVLGLLAVASFAPWEVWPLIFLSLAGLCRLWAGAASPRAGFFLGFFWGFGFFAAGIGWLFVALHRFAGLAALPSALAIGLFSAYLALYPALVGYLFVRGRTGRPLHDALLVAVLWMLSELLRGLLFTGFPWLSVGYSQIAPSPLAGYFPVMGVYGVGGVTMGLAALLAIGGGAVMARRSLWACAFLAAGVVLHALHWTRPHGHPLEVALIQTNIPQDLKWSAEHVRENLSHVLHLVGAHKAPLVVLPETVLPFVLNDLPDSYLDQLMAPLHEDGGHLIMGVFMRDEAERLYNSALKLHPEGRLHYAKQHLVPFGEYSPPLFGWFYRWLDIPMSQQTPGAPHPPPFPVSDQLIATSICYEDVFGEALITALPQASILLNLSNLAWYGDSHAKPQHLQIAKARALETGRPMLRASNTGMTAVIGPKGQIIGQLPTFETAALRVSVQGYQGLTPYVRVGNRLVWGLAVCALIFLALQNQQRWRADPP